MKVGERVMFLYHGAWKPGTVAAVGKRQVKIDWWRKGRQKQSTVHLMDDRIRSVLARHRVTFDW